MEDYIQFSAKTKSEAITKACIELFSYFLAVVLRVDTPRTFAYCKAIRQFNSYYCAFIKYSKDFNL